MHPTNDNIQKHRNKTKQDNGFGSGFNGSQKKLTKDLPQTKRENKLVTKKIKNKIAIEKKKTHTQI